MADQAYRGSDVNPTRVVGGRPKSLMDRGFATACQTDVRSWPRFSRPRRAHARRLHESPDPSSGGSERSASSRVKLPHRPLTTWSFRSRRTWRRSLWALPRHHLLPYLLIDWTGLRVGAIRGARVGDLDERRQALLARASIAKNRKPLWVGLHDVLFAAMVASMPPREDRDLAAPLVPGFSDASLRTSITRACRTTGTPHFSPHGLRKRRGSLLSKQGYTLAEIAERLGDTKVVDRRALHVRPR